LKLLFEVFRSEHYEAAAENGIRDAVQYKEHIDSVREQRLHPSLEFSEPSTRKSILGS